jgi:hypothetical protein
VSTATSPTGVDQTRNARQLNAVLLAGSKGDTQAWRISRPYQFCISPWPLRSEVKTWILTENRSGPRPGDQVISTHCICDVLVTGVGLKRLQRRAKLFREGQRSGRRQQISYKFVPALKINRFLTMLSYYLAKIN